MGGASEAETTVREVTFTLANNATLYCKKLNPVFYAKQYPNLFMLK